MYYPFYYRLDPLYLGIALFSLILVLFAQGLVKSRYAKYSNITNIRGLTGAEAARAVLSASGVNNVLIEEVSGKLTDHYDPKKNVIRLSEGVYSSKSIAAVGIAAHEAGHAVQYAQNYAPVKVRTAIIPLARYGPSFGIMLALIGFALNSFNLTVIGLLLYATVFVFQLITLPVEFNAGRRALKAIADGNLLYGEEYSGAKKVLTAAALTYVAAMLQALLTLLYYCLRLLGRRRN